MMRTFPVLQILFFIVFLSHFDSTGQGWQNNKWHFGINGAVDFNPGTPVATAGSAIFTAEGSASVADRVTGDLLFYTNGITIWNRLNQPMPNGTGLLGGTPALTSSTTAARIIPRPGNPDQYYVFTVDEFGGPGGLRLNLVDMTLNGGLGDVVAGQKNILVSNDNIAEKLECAPLPNALGYWLLSRQVGGNQYMAWQVTAAGVSAAPVISFAGTSTINGAGYLKFSRDYTRLANAYVAGTVDVLSFNNVTGQVSNIVSLPVPIGSSVYGVEFSPSGRYLYVSNLLNGLFQFDLNAPNVAASMQTVAPAYAAALQLGPDCKIYVADGGLSIIPDPDLSAPACGYLPGAVNIQPGGSSYGLPMKVIDLGIYTAQISMNSVSPCTGAAVQFGFSGLSLFPQFIEWDFGDPASGQANTIAAVSSAQVAHIYNQPGQYIVRAIYEFECRRDTVFDTLNVVSCNVPANTCIDFQYTGSVQQWTVPQGVDTILVKMWGAAGGGGSDAINNAGGGGGFTEVTMTVTPGQVLDIYVGGGGIAASANTGGAGGWPNGGNGGSGNRVENGATVGGAGGGGGRSEIRIGGTTYAIAGGGGGGSSSRFGGAGGGLTAEFTGPTNQFDVNGYGGTQTAGGVPSSNNICGNPVPGTAGAFLQGGTGATDLGGGVNDRTGGGGGGDGYYGGGGGGSHDGCFGVGSAGGGGSGYVCGTCPGVTGTTSTGGIQGSPANPSDPLLVSFPGTGTGTNNTTGGNGLVNICYDSTDCTPTTSGFLITACGSYLAPNGALLTIPGLYIITIQNAAGCDSSISILLTFNDTVIAPPIIASACSSYTAPWGIVYTQSGTYSDTLSTVNGCDSIVSVNLTISGSVIAPPLAATACSSYTAPWGTVYTQSGTYSDTLSTVNGCDSIVSVNLTISGSVIAPPLAATACSSYTAPWGVVYTQSGAYSDTLTTVNGCDSIVSVDLTITGLPTSAVVTTPESCGESNGTATVTVAGGSGGYTYVWSNGSSGATVSGLGTGIYTVSVTDQSGCSTLAQAVVTGTAAPLVSVTSGSTFITEGDSVQLNAGGAQTYQWTPSSGLSCTDCASPVASPGETTTYFVTGTDSNGCSRTTSVTIRVDIRCNEVFVPNIFSPDGTGPEANNQLCVFGNCITEMNFAIYDRWGQLVFQTEDQRNCWDGNKDGKEAQIGVYTYRLYARQLNGVEIIKAGNITLIR